MFFKVLALYLSFVFPVYSAGLKGPNAKVIDLKFKDNLIGVVIDSATRNGGIILNEKYFSINSQNFTVNELTKKDFSNDFNVFKDVDYWKTTNSTDGSKISYEYLPCDQKELEIDKDCKLHDLKFENNRIVVNLKNICGVACFPSVVEKFNDLLFMGLAFNEPKGSHYFGVAVFDLEKKTYIKSLYTNRNSTFYQVDVANSSTGIIRRSPDNKSIWIGGSFGLYQYDSDLNLIKSCELYGAYFVFDPQLQMDMANDRFDFSCK